MFDGEEEPAAGRSIRQEDRSRAVTIGADTLRVLVTDHGVELLVGDRADGRLRVKIVALIDRRDFSEALADMNLAALFGGITPSGKPAVMVH